MQFSDISKIAGFVVSNNDIKQLLDSNEIDLCNNKVKLYIIPINIKIISKRLLQIIRMEILFLKLNELPNNKL